MRRFGFVARFKLLLVIIACALIGALALSSPRSSANSNRTAPNTRADKPAAPAANATTHASMRSGAAQPNAGAAPAQNSAPAVEGCVSCHGNTEPMHVTDSGKLGADGKDGQGLSCTYCHGGNPVGKTIADAHVRPRHPEYWEYKGQHTSAKPERLNALLNLESWEYVRFVNVIAGFVVQPALVVRVAGRAVT